MVCTCLLVSPVTDTVTGLVCWSSLLVATWAGAGVLLPPPPERCRIVGSYRGATEFLW